MTEHRLERLRRVLAGTGLGAVAVVPGPNMFYLTGLSLHLSERPVVAIIRAEGAAAIIVPLLEEATAAEGLSGWQVFTYDDTSGPDSAFAEAVEVLHLGGERLGVEARRCRFLELALLEHAGRAPQVEAADALFARLRMRKDEAERAAMREAVAIAQRAFDATLRVVRVGTTEMQVAAELTVQMLQRGSAPELPFAPIVASGSHGAIPHAVPTGRRLAEGDLVTLDWGASAGGYFSDITRNVAVGEKEPASELLKAHAVVREANAAGRAAVRPGASAQEVDRAARAVMEAAGLSDYFIHRTGHGLGLESHEEPEIKEGSLLRLEPGMTFTVEPGVYIPGLGGVRIEDEVVVTDGGAETMTTLTRELMRVG